MASATVKFPKAVTQHYISAVRKRIPVHGALLFGSFAYGKPTKHSDVDLIIISPRFAKIRDRLVWLQRIRDKKTYQVAMDIVGYTPKEFSTIERQSATMAKAKKDGKWIYKKR